MPLDNSNLPRLTFRALVYGNPGTGKTYLISTLPKPVGILSIDPGGWYTLRSFITKSSQDYSIEDLWEAQGDKYLNCAKAVDDVLQGKLFQNCSSIVLDSLTSLSEIALSKAQQIMTWGGASSKQVPSGSMGEPDRKHYHGEGVAVKKLVNKLLTLNKNLLIIAHERNDYDEEGTLIATYPAVRGPDKGSSLTKNFSEVYHSVVKTVAGPKGPQQKYLLDTVGNNRLYAKSRLRSQCVPPLEQFIEPNLSAVINSIK